jgi:hypothetical protein
MRAVIKQVCGGALVIAGSIAATIALSCTESAAATLPAATYSNAANVTLPNSQTFSDGSNDPQFAQVTGNNGITHWDFHTSNNYQTPSVSAQAISGPGVKGAAGSTLTYYIRFNGAPGNLDVNVRAEGGSLASGPNAANSYGHNQASASVFIARTFDNGGTGPDFVNLTTSSNAVGAPPANPSQGFTYNQTVSFIANTVYRILLQANAESWADDDAPNEGRLSSAYADPTFSGFAGYQFEISDGIGNSLVATTPIPTALPLFASALAGLGALRWRRQRKTVTVA